jgi:hypothetical protein
MTEPNTAVARSRLDRLRRWGAGPDDDAGRARGAAAVFSGRQRVLLLLGFALLTMLRLPQAWLHGRFLDEEGTIFLAYAWHHPASDALWRSFGGYLNLTANGATLLAARLVRAGWLPLARAPYLTMTLALASQLIPAALLLTGRGRWLANRWAVLASLLLLASCPMSEEVFANVLHIQFHLALAVALILALDVPRARVAQAAYGLVLLVAPLCGPGAIILFPFFPLRAVLERDRGRIVQSGVFAVGVALQLLLFFRPSPVRGRFLDPATLSAIMFTRLALLPFSSEFGANAAGRAFGRAYAAGSPWWGAAAVLGVAYFGWLALAAVRDRRDAAVWLIVPGLAVAGASFGGGMIDSASREWFSTGAGERYNYIPLLLVSFGLIALAMRHERAPRRTAAVLVMLTLVSGAVTFAMPITEVRRGPDWAAEVARWRGDHDYPLASWPADWRVDLSDHDRPCLSPTATGEPSYCESAWLARVRRAIAIDKAKR